MDFYVTLGLKRGATLLEIKRAYRRLARRFHPDISPGDREAAEFFRRIIEAYDTLSDPERRRGYDAQGALRTEMEPSGVEFQGFDFSMSVDGSNASTFGDLFADVFRQRGSQWVIDRPEDGADLHTVGSLTFEEAMQGVTRQITVTRLATCSVCKGLGVRRSAERRCRRCQGTGTLRWVRGHMVFSNACSDCAGTGRQRRHSCTACEAEGVVQQSERISMQVSPGISDGTRIRIPGKGNAGRRGGVPGDLCISVQVAKHHLFRRDGDDLHLVVSVAIHEAGLGAKIDVPIIDGWRKLRIPPGTQSGQLFRLRGHGVPSARSGQRGDLIIETRLALPRLVDERSKELLKEFGRINSEDVRNNFVS